MERRWQVASIGGIPIYVTVPWLAFAALVVWGTYQSLLSAPLLTSREALGWSLANAALFYGSIVVHELAHAVTARAFHVGVRGITLVFWGGYTETNPGQRGPLASFLISAAGPFSTLVLAGIFWIGARLTDAVPAELLGNLAFLSLLFAGLNTLPGFPVDGGRMLLAAVWGITRDRFTAMKVAGWGGVAVGAVLGVIALQQLQSRNGGWIFFAFVGWMMIGQGMQVTRQVPLLRALARGVVRDAMRPPPFPIPAGDTLLNALETHLRTDRSTEFPVVDAQGRLAGSLSFQDAAKVGRKDPMRPVADAMTPRDRVRMVGSGQPLDRAIESMAGAGQALVVDDGRLIGLITAEDVDRWYRQRGARSMQPEPRVGVPPRPDLPGARGVGGAG
jgi:Zn-dependent protease/CBS domain-containing protein